MQLFWKSFQNAKICWQVFVKGKTFNYCHINISNLLQQCQWHFFKLELSTLQNQHGKIKINCLKKCMKLGTYQTQYLVKTFISIISTWCIYHAVHLVLQLHKSFDPQWPNVVSRPQDPTSRHFSRFYNLIGFTSWFLWKWNPVCQNWSQGSELMGGYLFWAQVA